MPLENQGVGYVDAYVSLIYCQRDFACCSAQQDGVAYPYTRQTFI